MRRQTPNSNFGLPITSDVPALANYYEHLLQQMQVLFTIWASITIHGLVHATHRGGPHPQVTILQTRRFALVHFVHALDSNVHPPHRQVQ